MAGDGREAVGVVYGVRGGGSDTGWQGIHGTRQERDEQTIGRALGVLTQAKRVVSQRLR